MTGTGGDWNHGILWLCIYFHIIYWIYWEFHHPNWRIPSFFRGVGWNHQPVITKVSLVHIYQSLIWCIGEQYNIIIHNRTRWWMIKSTMYLFWPKWLNATISGVGLNHQPVIISSSHDLSSTTGAFFAHRSWERGLSRTGRPEWHAADAAVPVWSPWKERLRRWSAEDFWGCWRFQDISSSV